MPLTARTSEGEPINIIEVTGLDELKGKEFFCTLCGSVMMARARNSPFYVPHFYHRNPCTNPMSRPESREHRTAKWAVFKQEKYTYADCPGVKVDLEVAIPEAGRQADVLVTFPFGWRIAHEIQLSSITIEELQRRTDDYERCGVEVCWWFGVGGPTKAAQRWVLDRDGFYGEVRFEREPEAKIETLAEFES